MQASCFCVSSMCKYSRFGWVLKLLHGMALCCLHHRLHHWSLQITNVNKCQHAASCIDYNHYNQTAFWADRWIWMWKGICRTQSSRLLDLHDVKFTSHTWLDDVLCLTEMGPLTVSVTKAVAIHILNKNVSDLSLFSADWIDLLCCWVDHMSTFWAYLQLFEWFFMHHVTTPSVILIF